MNSNKQDLTTGPVTGKLLSFAFPMMAGNLLQQFYNVADTLIVGRFLGADALAAVGSAYTLMVFLTSILLGLCMGSGAAFSIQFGRKDDDRLKQSILIAFLLIAAITMLLNIAAFCGLGWIIRSLQAPEPVAALMREYLWVVFWGIAASFLYNFFAALLRSVGNSAVPLLFLGISAALNIALDLLFVLQFDWGVKGAAAATVISQYLAGFGCAGYVLLAAPRLRPGRRHMRWNIGIAKELAGLSLLTCVQQSVMNLGILMVQSLVNSFGTTVMAAFAAAVKIDSLAYLPAQDFGNAFSTFTAQNYGAQKPDRIRKGIKSAAACSFAFCVAASAAVCLFARPLMEVFVRSEETAIIAEGVRYLRIEAAFYCGIGLLFLLYGFYRAVGRPGMSVILTAISLGARVALAYTLSRVPSFGVIGIWIAVPIGWAMADLTGILAYPALSRKARKTANAAPQL